MISNCLRILAVVKEHVLTTSTDMWVPVEDPSSQSKLQVPDKDSY